MQGEATTIFCPNPMCQAPNPESHRFCHQCRTPIPKRYLWVVGKGADNLKPGEFLGSRYLVKRDRIVLDTQPGLPPELPEDISVVAEPYLKLSTCQPQVPQIFGLVEINQKRSSAELLLLEQAPIYPEDLSGQGSASVEGSLMPLLTNAWAASSGIRQLNWLWQIAHLWQPFSLQRVASTLLTPELLRVEGSLVRLLQLQIDGRSNPTLSDLGRLWQQWQPTAQPDIAAFFTQLCQQMVQGNIRNAEQLVMVLDSALAVCGQYQTRAIQIATLTDQGPSRQRNEDACYPTSGTVLTINSSAREGLLLDASQAVPLVVVCDGIGGHEGGEVASNLAIATIQQKLQRLLLSPSAIDPASLSYSLEQATLAANDVISQRNDAEQRQERQRMGTTLVMSLVHNHELYITHVGDSRAYRIGRTGCHQVTLDDDLASREVRLGYSLYRDALQQPGSGSLVQALGMNPSSMLHPTVQRFVLDEDCLFLLCSDGLSDNDRVEQHWQTELLPVLEGKVDVATAVQRLVALANRENGHDNVTVGLVSCQVSREGRMVAPALDPALAIAPDQLGVSSSSLADFDPSISSPTKTQVLSRRQSSGLLPWLLGLAIVLGLVGLGALFISMLRSQLNPSASVSPSPLETNSPLTEPPPPPSSPAPLTVGSIVQVDRLIPNSNQTVSIALLPEPPRSGASQSITTVGTVPVGSVLQVSSKQSIPRQGTWLKLRVCSVPADASIASQPVQAGQTGWIEEGAIAALVVQEPTLTPTQLGNCTTSAASPTFSSELEQNQVRNEGVRR